MNGLLSKIDEEDDEYFEDNYEDEEGGDHTCR